MAFLGTKIRKKSEIKTKLRVFFIFTLYKGNKKPQKGQFSPLFAVFAVVPQSAVFYKTSGGGYVYPDYLMNTADGEADFFDLLAMTRNLTFTLRCNVNKSY